MMKRCPFCGAMLAAALVDAIVDPFRDESCPSQPKIARRVEARLERRLDALTGASR